MYCLARMQALRLDSESSLHCSQSSSSDSTGSRSPPETPPAAPWVGSDNNNVAPPVTDHMNSVHSTATAPLSHIASASTSQPMQSSVPPESRQLTRKNTTRTMRHKSQGILNGIGNNGNNGGPPSLPHCVSFPAPPTHSQLAYLPHGHAFPALRPGNSGIYSNFLHGPSARPAYPAAYQPNGEIMYSYTGHPAAASGSTPPPPPPPNAAAAATPVQASYMPPTSVVTYAAAAVIPPTKISCYNCGSSSHLAVDCKDQTMEDLTKKGTSSYN